MPPHQDVTQTIPQEIFNLIVYHSRHHPNTLYNLCLVSTYFQLEAQRLLYYELRISNDGRPTTSSRVITIDTSRVAQLFSTLIQHNPSLSKHTRILYHCVTGHGSLDSEYWISLNKVLLAMVNLKKITLYRFIPPGVFQDFNTTGMIFRLENLECSHSCATPSFRSSLLEFLATQCELKSLYIVWGSNRDITTPATTPTTGTTTITRPSFPSNICRGLKLLAGDRYTIENILPGREDSIEELTWVPARDEHWIGFDRLGRIVEGLGRIRKLSLGGYHPRPHLEILVPYLSELRILRLIGFTNANLSEECDLVPALQNLRIFIWSASISAGLDWDSHPPIPRENQEELVDRWFREMKLLEVAYFQTCDSRLWPERCYLCWRRGDGDGPRWTDFHEAVEEHGLTPWFS